MSKEDSARYDEAEELEEERAEEEEMGWLMTLSARPIMATLCFSTWKQTAASIVTAHGDEQMERI